MLRQFNHSTIRICGSLPAPQSVSVREKSKYRGKKEKNFDVVKWQHNNVPLQPHEDFEPDEWLPRRLTYYPEGLWASLVPRPRPHWFVDRHKPITIVPPGPPEKEWNDVAVYPEVIRDPEITHPYRTSYLNRMKWYKELAEIPEVDEKNAAIAKITRLSLHFDKPFFNYYGGLEVAQNITRTHLVNESFPESYNINDVEESLVNKLTPLLLDAVRVNKYDSSRARVIPLDSEIDDDVVSRWKDRIAENNLLQEINYCVSNVLVPSTPHLLNLQVDVESQVRSWWYTGQLPLPTRLSKHILWKSRGYKKIDQAITYNHATPVQIRTSSPLPRIVSGNDELSSKAEIPTLNYHPTRLGHRIEGKYLVSIPGFWPERNFDPVKSEPNDFPFLTMFGLRDLACRKTKNYYQDFKDDTDVVKCKAILGSFAWLNSLAFNHGFTPFHEITYPFINQGLVTDGQKWHFFVYQMNAHSFHSDIFLGDGPKNLCWISPEIKLYESYQDGQFNGINDAVARYLIKMYTKVPCKEPDVAYRPYVGRDLRAADLINETRKTLGLRVNQVHEEMMHSYKFARIDQLYHKLFVDNPDYNTTMMRVAIRPKLKPAEDYYYRWKY